MQALKAKQSASAELSFLVRAAQIPHLDMH